MGSTVTVSGTVEAVMAGVEDWALDEEADHVSAAATTASRDEEVDVDVRETELEVQVVSLPY